MLHIDRIRCAVVTIGCTAIAACAAQQAPPTALPATSAVRTAALTSHWRKESIGKFADPYGVAVDASGNVYVADPGSKSVLKIAPNGEREHLGDFSLALGSAFDPQGVSIAKAGYVVYVADRGTRAIWWVKPNNSVGKVYTEVGQPSHYPRGVAYGAFGGAYASIATTNFADPKGVVRCVLDPCPFFGLREFVNPYGVAVDNRGVAYVADAGAKRVFRIDSAGMASIGTFSDPYGVAVTPDGSTVYVADAGAKKVYQGLPDGSSWTQIGTFGDPYGVAAAANGDVYVADPGSKDVWKLTP